VHHPAQTVLITGASSGIGAELARRLAAEGSDLVLVARRTERLEALATDLRTRAPVTVHTIAADLSRPAAGYELLQEVQQRGVEVTSVVNNAGFGVWGELVATDPAELRRMIAVNITAVVDISRAFIPLLREHGHGYLVNVTSLAAYSSIPMQGAYSASKAFVLSFTESLWAEMRGTGVRVLAYAPGVTRTEFFEVLATAPGADTARAQAGPAQTPAQVVDGLLEQLARRDPPPSRVSGHLNHLLSVLPRYFTRRRAVLITAAQTMRSR
jgi:hypothetical protein